MPDKVVIITGCSTGIGRATALELARAGYKVVATARRVEALADLPVALKLPLDVEETASVQSAVQATLDAFGRIDVLVNNAGYGQFGAIEELSDAQLHKVFEVNVHGPARMVRAVAPVMRRQGAGHIVNLSSVAGRIAIPMIGAYCATKFAVEAMSDALRSELAMFGIHVVLIEPGAIRTEFETTARAKAGAIFTQPNSPYAPLYAAAMRALTGQNSSAPGPEAVARVIRRAVESSHPRARYQVPASAAFAVRGVALVPARAFDWMIQAFMRRLAR